MRRHLQLFIVLLAALLAQGSACAQPQTTLAPAKIGVIANLVPVPAPLARAVALSEPLGLLAFVHDKTHADAHVSLVKLDAKGTPLAYAVPWKLPHVKGLEKHPNYALSVAFHPKLPLLYVWQDLNLNYTNPPGPAPAELKQFDRLLVYRVAKEPPELLLSLCRGPEIVYGQGGGALAVDPQGEFLLLPNLRDLVNAGAMRFGRVRLDGDGLPLFDEAAAKLPLAERAKKLAELNAAKPFTITDATPVEYVYNFPLNAFGTGHSFHVVSKEAIIAGGINGVMAWRPDDKVAVIHGMPLKTGAQTLLGPHPSLPAVYATRVGGDSLFQVQHSEGYLSLLPHQVAFPDTKLFSAPIVLGRGGKLAVGGQHHVHLLSLDANGLPAGESLKMQVLNPQARTLVYSEKHDRLYVGVEQSK